MQNRSHKSKEQIKAKETKEQCKLEFLKRIRGGRPKKEQGRRDAQANRLRALRKRIREDKSNKPKFTLEYFPWPCRKCGTMTPADRIKFRVCPVCIAGKEDKAEKALLLLVMAGIDARIAKDEISQLVIGC